MCGCKSTERKAVKLVAGLVIVVAVFCMWLASTVIKNEK